MLYLADHLRQVHKLSSEGRQPLLKAGIFSHQVTPSVLPGVQPQGLYSPYILQHGMSQYPLSMSSQLQQPISQPQSMKPKQPKVMKLQTVNCLETQPYPKFKFNHMFSMVIVGPTQCGKTYFVQQVLTKNCIQYPSEKSTQIYWFYNQWQQRYDALRRVLRKRIQFTQGLPDLSEDLKEINPEYNNILVFDDLISQAIDSPVLSQLFTQGRHRNASVILLLQNMFPKGKYNTDINRNAQYVVLFRSPSDRKHIDILAERTFAKDRKNFMSVYAKETAKPYGYVLIDNQTKTTSDKQVVSDVFGHCQRYPSISTHVTEGVTQQDIATTEGIEQPKPTVTHKVEIPVPKQSVKRRAEHEKPPAKKAKTMTLKKESQSTKKQRVKTKPEAKKSKAKNQQNENKMRWDSFTPRNSHTPN